MDGKTYRFDGWINEAGARVTQWDTNPNSLYEPNEAEMTDGVVVFRAYYVPAEMTLTIEKLVKGNAADRSKEFSFTYSYDGMPDTENNKFTLGHEGETTITVPSGTPITVTETTGGYTTSWSYTYENARGEEQTVTSPETSKDGGEKICKLTVSADTTLTFVNTADIIPDTGVLLDSWPYILILAVAAAGAVIGVVRKRRRDMED